MARPSNKQKYKGRRNGRLVAMKWVAPSKWLFKCDCGSTKVIPTGSVFRENRPTVQSCGCLYREIMLNGGFQKTHGMSGTKFYKAWDSMKSRCYRVKDARYKYYGGRGIKVLWGSFEDFKRDMYDSFLEHNKKHGGRQTSLDRIDVDKNYCKENCKWSTQKEQQNNRTI